MKSYTVFDEQMRGRITASPLFDTVEPHIDAASGEPCDMRIVSRLLEDVRKRDLPLRRRAMSAWALGRLNLHERQQLFVAGALLHSLNPAARRRRPPRVWIPIVWTLYGVLFLAALCIDLWSIYSFMALTQSVAGIAPDIPAVAPRENTSELRAAIVASLGHLLPPRAWSLLLPFAAERDTQVSYAAQEGLRHVLLRAPNLQDLEIDRASVSRVCALLPRASQRLALMLVSLLEPVDDRLIDITLTRISRLPHNTPVRAQAIESLERRRAMRHDAASRSTLLRPSWAPRDTGLLLASQTAVETHPAELLRSSAAGTPLV